MSKYLEMIDSVVKEVGPSMEANFFEDNSQIWYWDRRRVNMIAERVAERVEALFEERQQTKPLSLKDLRLLAGLTVEDVEKEEHTVWPRKESTYRRIENGELSCGYGSTVAWLACAFKRSYQEVCDAARQTAKEYEAKGKL